MADMRSTASTLSYLLHAIFPFRFPEMTELERERDEQGWAGLREETKKPDVIVSGQIES